MATFDQNGKEVDDLAPVVVTAKYAVPELEEFAVVGKRYDWSGLVYALLAGVVVYVLDKPRTRRRRR